MADNLSIDRLRLECLALAVSLAYTCDVESKTSANIVLVANDFEAYVKGDVL